VISLLGKPVCDKEGTGDSPYIDMWRSQGILLGERSKGQR
jgi:hypothetical protein